MLSENGHVIAPRTRLDRTHGAVVELKRTGRNRATTFAGLCAHHDARIFAPIDFGLDLDNPLHRLLLAYRATFRELHVLSSAAWKVQHGYLARVRMGFDDGRRPSPAGMAGATRLMLAYECFRYKAIFDDALQAGDYSAIEHDIFVLDTPVPTVAASTVFSLDHVCRDEDVVRACLTILPMDEKRTGLLLSYTRADASLARGELAPVLTSHGDEQKFELSRRLLNSCDNFVLSPRFVESWSERKRQSIERFFVETALHDDLGRDDPELLLFH